MVLTVGDIDGPQGANPRFVVTNLEGHPVQLYEQLYCQRGEAENRIKEAQLDLFGTRASCPRFVWVFVDKRGTPR
jgi:hypothetical protein